MKGDLKIVIKAGVFLAIVYGVAVPVRASTAEHPAPEAGATTPVKQSKEGEMDVTIKGQSREKLVINKFDPPAAFALEDIQNFPEERLQPVLNNPVTFDEGKDFSTMMDFQEDQYAHPWLPEIAQAPFLKMKVPPLDKPRDWTFTIIDQAGATVAKQEGHGNPPGTLSWNGEDSQRGHAAVDTVYIPQLMTVDKDGYHHTYMGQPVQFSSLLYKDAAHVVVEVSTKRLFQENKAEFAKEAAGLLQKVSDVLRQEAHTPFAIQPYDADPDLAKSRQNVLLQYFRTKLVLTDKEVLAGARGTPEKRGAAVAIMTNAGGAGL